MNRKEGKGWGGPTIPSPPPGEKATDVGLDGRAQGMNLNGKDTREGEGGRNGRDICRYGYFRCVAGLGSPSGRRKRRKSAT